MSEPEPFEATINHSADRFAGLCSRKEKTWRKFMEQMEKAGCLVVVDESEMLGRVFQPQASTYDRQRYFSQKSYPKAYRRVTLSAMDAVKGAVQATVWLRLGDGFLDIYKPERRWSWKTHRETLTFVPQSHANQVAVKWRRGSQSERWWFHEIERLDKLYKDAIAKEREVFELEVLREEGKALRKDVVDRIDKLLGTLPRTGRFRLVACCDEDLARYARAGKTAPLQLTMTGSFSDEQIQQIHSLLHSMKDNL